MPRAAPAIYALACHPATPGGAVRGLTVDVAWAGGASAAPVLHLRYTLHAELARLRIPPPTASAQALDGLWRHTCFEAFVGAADGTAYREFNFATSGDWAGYAFAAERVRAAAREPLPAPRIVCAPAGNALTLDAWLPAATLPAASETALALGLSAVIEHADGGLSYWALAHPRPQPDFHQRSGWTARLPWAG